MERELARLATAYLSLQRVQRAVPPRTRRGSAELRTFSVQSRRADLYPRVRACVESGLGEGGAEGRRRACDALRRLEAYELFSTPLPEELGGVKAYQGDGDVVEVQPIKRRVVVDLTGGPDSGNEQRERASGRRRSRARAATVKAEGEVSSVAAGEHEEDLDDGGGDPKPAEDEDEDEDLDVGGGDPKPAEDNEDEDERSRGQKLAAKAIRESKASHLTRACKSELEHARRHHPRTGAARNLAEHTRWYGDRAPVGEERRSLRLSLIHI